MQFNHQHICFKLSFLRFFSGIPQFGPDLFQTTIDSKVVAKLSAKVVTSWEQLTDCLGMTKAVKIKHRLHTAMICLLQNACQNTVKLLHFFFYSV